MMVRADKAAKIRKAEEKAKTNLLTKQRFSFDSISERRSVISSCSRSISTFSWLTCDSALVSISEPATTIIMQTAIVRIAANAEIGNLLRFEEESGFATANQVGAFCLRYPTAFRV